MRTLTVAAIAIFSAALLLGGKPYVHLQSPIQSEADSQWADSNLKDALNAMLPMDRPDPSFEDQEYITYRYTNWFYTPSREYSFSLMRRSHEGAGPLRFYWLARVRMADGASIRVQLAQLHTQHPDEDLAEVEQRIRIKTWALDEKTCPAVRVQAVKFPRISFKVPFSFEIILDAHSFEFQVGSLNSNLKLSLGVHDHPLVAWATETRRALAQCGAVETAPLRREPY